MRIRVSHQTTYRYAPAAKSLIQTLRLTPRNHETQFVVNWRIGVDVDGRLRQAEDAFGNITHVLSAAGPIEHLTLSVEGAVETQDTAGMVRGTVERFPEILYLRDTPLTESNDQLQTYASEASAVAGADQLGAMHALMGAIHRDFALEPRRSTGAIAGVEALEARSGDAASLAHVFIACARFLGVPTRHVSGYLWKPDEPGPAQAGHAWAEAYVEGYGWVGFDPSRDICPTASYIRVAAGLDDLGASPVRGAHLGGEGNKPEIAVRIDAQEQSQA